MDGRFKPPAVGRRRFVQGLAAGGVVVATRGWTQQYPGAAQSLSGTHFDLVIGERQVNFTGQRRPETELPEFVF